MLMRRFHGGISLIQRDYFDEQIMGTISCEGDYYPESKAFTCYKTQTLCRILKNSDKVYFSYPVYEIAEESIKLNRGDFVYSDIVIHHYGRLVSREKAIAKREYYISSLVMKYLTD